MRKRTNNLNSSLFHLANYSSQQSVQQLQVAYEKGYYSTTNCIIQTDSKLYYKMQKYIKQEKRKHNFTVFHRVVSTREK